MVIMAGMNKGIPNDAFGLLRSPGHPVSRLAMARVMTLGEEFLDGKDEVDPALMSIVLLLEEVGFHWR